MPEAFLGDFKSCNGEERLAILTLIAGHTDRAALDLIKLGLRDSDAAVQRAALVRLLAFSEATAVPLLESYLKQASESLHQLAQAVRSEIEKRSLFPFLGEASDTIASASETTFPSRSGTVPMVSPDGQWVAYVETGWHRPGGTGGMGRSKPGSPITAGITHAQGRQICGSAILKQGLRLASPRHQPGALTVSIGLMITR